MDSKSASKSATNNATITEEVKKRPLFRSPGERMKVKHSRSLDATTQVTQAPSTANNNYIDENIAAIKEQVEIAIRNVDEEAIDTMSVGQTPIHKNKAVILSWSTNQSMQAPPLSVETNEGKKNEEGIVFYVAIKMKSRSIRDLQDENKEIDHEYDVNLTSDDILFVGQSSESGMGNSVISVGYDNQGNQNQSIQNTNKERISNANGNDNLKPEIESKSGGGGSGSIRSALSRRQAKNNWLRLVTKMRNVNIADCENMFIKDEYRNISFDEEDMLAAMNGEYLVKTPSVEYEEDNTSSKRRVTWRESLEDTFYDDNDCLVVDITDETGASKLQYKNERKTNKTRSSDGKSLNKAQF